MKGKKRVVPPKRNLGARARTSTQAKISPVKLSLVTGDVLILSAFKTNEHVGRISFTNLANLTGTDNTTLNLAINNLKRRKMLIEIAGDGERHFFVTDIGTAYRGGVGQRRRKRSIAVANVEQLDRLLNRINHLYALGIESVPKYVEDKLRKTKEALQDK